MAGSIILYKYKITIGIVPIYYCQETVLKYLTVLRRWYRIINWQKDGFSFTRYAPPHHDLYNIWTWRFWDKMWTVLLICFAPNIFFFLPTIWTNVSSEKICPYQSETSHLSRLLVHFLRFKRLGARMIIPFLSALLQYPISVNLLYLVALCKDVGFHFWNSAIIDFSTLWQL